MSDVFPSGEFELISELQEILGPQRNDAYEIMVGDDAAVRRCLPSEKLIVTTDISVENVHFSLQYMSLEEIGYRAMVSNVSDCAAMGAEPDSALIQLIFPRQLPSLNEAVGNVYRGFARACRRWNFAITGGDLSVGQSWMIGITLLGTCPGCERVVRRKGARDGDLLWVSNFPGRSAAGLAALKKWGSDSLPEKYKWLAQSHIAPSAQVELGIALRQNQHVHAMMDLSDGLSKDCRTLAYENGLGINLKTDTSLIPDTMIQLSEELQIPARDWLLHGGEDYELLFAASPEFDVSGVRDICDNLMCIGNFTDEHNDIFENAPGGGRIGEGSWDHTRGTLH